MWGKWIFRINGLFFHTHSTFMSLIGHILLTENVSLQGSPNIIPVESLAST